MLRVVHRAEGDDIAIITAHFDRGARRLIRTSYDPEADAIFVWFRPEGVKSAGTEEVSPGIMLDFDIQRRVIGIEILDVSERMNRSSAAA